MLLAFLIYNDGIGTIIRMATIYGAEIGIDQGAMIASILIVQFVGIPVLVPLRHAGRQDRRQAVDPARARRLHWRSASSATSCAPTAHFLILAILVGMVQGGTQALSRSLFASLIPRDKSGEFFGFFAVVEKFAGIFGPGVVRRHQHA